MIIEKTTTAKIGKDTYTNNIETLQILKNDEVIRNYCIIAENNDIITIQSRDKITTQKINTENKEIVHKLLQPRKKAKTAKTTIKGKKQDKE